MTVFLCSVERRFSAPAAFATAAARSLGQVWPQATGEAGARRLDAGEHGSNLTEAGVWPACAECGRTSL
jgi:hypothetical protein